LLKSYRDKKFTLSGVEGIPGGVTESNAASLEGAFVSEAYEI